MANVPADSVWGADNVTASALPGGMKWYGGYANGPYANMSAIKARFPSAELLSIVVRLGGKGSAVDAEPGTLSGSQWGNFLAVLGWLRSHDYTGPKPIVYTMASWAQAMVNFLAANGFPRSSYYLWTAHYNGQHLCGSGGCGFLSGTVADITQYATGVNDYNVARGYVFSGGTRTFQTTGLSLGDTDKNTDGQVHGAQRQLNTWAKYCGFAPLLVDGDYGGKTFSAVRTFQLKRKLTADPLGTVGTQTENNLKTPPGVIKVIVAAPKPVPKPALPSGTPNIKLGDNGKAVAEIQYYLRNSGIYGVRGIEADGDFGSATLTSLKNFQAHAGLGADGVYGPATAKALAKVAVG